MGAAEPLLGRFFEQELTERLGLVGELGRVRLLRFADAPVDLLAFDLLLARPERRLALDHLVHQAAQTEKVRTERVALVVDHLRSCTPRRRKQTNKQTNQQREIDAVRHFWLEFPPPTKSIVIISSM